jgi:hypothetical protein
MMDGAGRPSLYKPEFAEQAYGLCLAGATNQELADGFDVGHSTIDNWLRKHPEFAQAVRSGRSLADGKVAHGLYARAIGYSYESTRVLLHRGEPLLVRHTCIARPTSGPASSGCATAVRSNGERHQGRRTMSAPQRASFRTRRS